MRILFTTVPLPGHFYPLVPLAWSLRALGHEVLVATSADFVPAALVSGLPIASCGPPADLVGLSTGDTVTGDLGARRFANGRVFGRIAVRNLPGLLSLVDSWQPDLVISERAESAGPVVAAVRGLPRVELHWGVAPLREYRMAAELELAADLARLGLPALPRPERLLNPWPVSLRLPYALGQPGIRHVTFTGAAHVPSWSLRPSERPRVCLTFGTLLPLLGPDVVPELVVPLLEKVARQGVEIVVAVDDEVAAGWPPLPAAVRHAGRMPLAEVLASCSVAIHHGGQGTALTALAAGRAQLVLPVFDDQLDNAEAVVRSGAGMLVPVEEITPALVAERCAELLANPRYGAAAARVAREIAAQRSPAEIARLFAGPTIRWSTDRAA